MESLGGVVFGGGLFLGLVVLGSVIFYASSRRRRRQTETEKRITEERFGEEVQR